MNRIRAIEQLQDLIKDREAFLIGGGDAGDEIFRKDIAALERAIYALQNERETDWTDPKKRKPRRYRTVLVQRLYKPTEDYEVVIGQWNGVCWETADVREVQEVYETEDDFAVIGWMELPR